MRSGWNRETLTSAVPAVFDIADVRIDNDNFTTAGNPIIAQNTAGDASSATDVDDNVYLILPVSIKNLRDLTIRKVLVTEDGVAVNSVDSFTIVDDGRVFGASAVGFVTVADNETVMTDNVFISIRRGTTMPDGTRGYLVSTGERMSDDRAGNENTISFDTRLRRLRES